MGYTGEQLLAINSEGENIIVSAGAGSGKTAVLTARVIRKLNSGIDVNKLLILTFTNEAANEMKNRIRDGIIKNHLDKQLGLLDEAYITTFDSFALSLVKKYNYLLNVSDNLKIVDSNMITIYKYVVLDKIFDSMYGDILFDKLINDLCLKDDKSIKDFIINISNKIDLEVDKEAYINNYLDKYYSTIYYQELLDRYLNIIKNKIKELVIIYENLVNYIDDKLITKIDDYISPLVNGENYNDYVLFNTKSAVRFTKMDETGLKYKEEFKDKISEIKELIRYRDSNEIIDGIKATYDYVSVIIRIIKELDNKVIEYKNSLNIYEFNDIAHMAIKIVKDNIEVREEIKNSFNEIMIDEYQDTSSIQETFINYIANNNVYMVGDIKQSIYRFRNANPYIFQDKYNRYSESNGGLKIDLIKNFRSRHETLDNINEIFNLIMDDEIGNANYLYGHNMIYGNTAYDKEDTGVNNKLEVYNYTMEDGDKYSKEEKELFIISEDIKDKIKNRYQVFDKKTNKLRNITYSDICIITDRNKYLPDYKKILEYHEIPSVIYMDEILTGDSIFLCIKNLIDLVWHIKNKNYDDKFRYLFTSIARSFIFNYPDQLIYDIHKDRKYYESEIFTLSNSIDINKPINNVINDIIEVFDVYNRLTVLPDIDKNITKIDNLIDLCNNFSSLGYDIGRIITYLDMSYDMDLQIKYSSNTSNVDAVKIMNIHKSKGLEFSLCYFTGMHNKFTIKEINSKLLFNNKYGIIMPYLYENELVNTINRDLYINDYFKEEISEKIRLFYVALTRCREKMIIVTSLNQDIEGYNRLVPDIVRMKYRSFLDIINSISVIDKYIVNKSANYTKEYNNIKLKEITSNNSNIIDKKRINLDYQIIQNKHFSKDNNKIFDKDTLKKMEYGSMIHEELEYANFKNSSNIYVNNLLKQIDNNFIDTYHEYEFEFTGNGIKYYGIIDLIIEYKDVLYIIDYKLKYISDDEYIKQLTGYKNYFKSITDKNIKTFLYSIKENILMEVECNE